jgi:hypothetical protein
MHLTVKDVQRLTPGRRGRGIVGPGENGRPAAVEAIAGSEPPPDKAPGTIAVRRRTLVRALLTATTLLALASVAVQISAHLLGQGRLLGLVHVFDMTREGNMPTWFSTMLLLACAAVLWVIWTAGRQREEPHARYWAALAVMFAAASLDETTALHETLGSAISGTGHVYWYLLPGTLLLLAIAVALRGFWLRLPQSARRRLALGAGIWVLGAVGLEGVEAIYWPGDGATPGFGLALLNTAQDVFELLGLLIILDALLRHAAECNYRSTVEPISS